MPYFLSIFSQCSCVKELVSTWDFLVRRTGEEQREGKGSARYFAPGENAIHFYNAAAAAAVAEPGSLSRHWNSS